MKDSSLKNMVVLKNLPSNLAEEAIVILKSNKKVKKLEKIENGRNKEISSNKSKKDKDYIVKEAEMLVATYISKLENEEKIKKDSNIKLNKKYERLKKYAFISTGIMLVQVIMILIK